MAAAGAVAFLLLTLLPATAGAARKPPPSPPLAWSGSSDFGTITSGSTTSQQFTLTNTGGKPSGAITTSLSGSSAFSITSDGCLGVSLGKGKSCAVTVQYAPANAGQSDAVALTASSKKAGSASVNLTGASAAAACTGVPVAVLDPSQGDVSATHPTFNASNSYDPCGRPLFYLWDCLDSAGSSNCDLMNSDPSVSSWTLNTSLGEVIHLGLIVAVYDPNDPNANTDPANGEIGYVYSAEDGPFQYNCVVTG